MPGRAYTLDATDTDVKGQLDRIFAELDLRLTKQEAREVALTDAERDYRDAAIRRISQWLEPLIAQLRAQVGRGALIAGSDTILTLAEGAVVEWIVRPEDRLSFSPPPYLVATHGAAAGVAVVRRIDWDPSIGLLRGAIESLTGSGGPYADWTLAATPGATLTQRAWLDETKTARDGAQAARTAAQEAIAATAESARATAADRIQTGQDRADARASKTAAAGSATTATEKAAEAAASAASVAGGPVTSVNGKKGVVVVAASDVGAYAKAEVDQQLSTLRGSADAAHDTLGELAALIDVLTAALNTLKGNADAAHDTLPELAALIDANTSAIALRALKESPEFTGIPKAPTAALGTNSTQIATMAALSAGLLDLRTFITNGAGDALDQFNEFANAIGNDPNFSATILDGLAKRIRYDAAQSLTSAQITQALTNIGVTLSALRTFLTATSTSAARSAIGAAPIASPSFTGTADADALTINSGGRVYAPTFITGSVPTNTAIGSAETLLVQVQFTATGTRAFLHGYGSCVTSSTATDVTWQVRLWDTVAGAYVATAGYVSTAGSAANGAAHSSPSGSVTTLVVGRVYQLRLTAYTSNGATTRTAISAATLINM